ncbi:ATP-grasp fold amidoligase family protein [Leyella lascolaii]|uniref:ATP-grasp fold amidoligase family protein n=1 Tax=Leyella lascolaii TaxID=1776379 RepID=UPI002943567C|nr:ATP-grasp fold amidoligase family protein [Leyella lascolaii]
MMISLVPRIKNRITKKWNEFLVDYFTKYVLSKYWYRDFHYRLDWNNPKDLNEKIQWLILNSDTSEWSRLADKVAVRDYVKEKGLGHMLIPLLGVWNDARKIDFDNLPDKFVLKCNHDSASVKIIDKSVGFDKKKIIEDFNNKLRVKFGYLSCEPHYNRIPPMIMAEEYLPIDGAGISKTPIDYKIWCFNGKPYIVWVAYNRDNVHGHVEVEQYDLKWNYHHEWGRFTNHYRDGGGKVPCPKFFDDMLNAAKLLSEGFPEVRVDFYDVSGKAYFGEMTFTSDCGRMPFYSKDFLLQMGELVDLSLAPKKNINENPNCIYPNQL